MADPPASEQGDPHNWNPLENYIFLHVKYLEEHPLTLPNSSLEFHILERPDTLYDTIVLEGIVYCVNGIQIEIHKSGDLDRTQARRVRMRLYSYNAWRPSGHNILRYDNLHRGHEDHYHRHLFDPNTGELSSLTELTRNEFPVMHQVFDELLGMFPAE